MGLQIPPFEYSTDRGYKFLCTFQIIGLKRSEDTIVWVEGGIPPYTWSISGTAFTIDNAITSVQYNTIRAVSNAEVNSTEEITVVDSEGSEVICKAHITDWDEEECCAPNPCSVPGGYVELAINNSITPSTISPNNTWVTVAITGGLPPYYWDDDGHGYTWEEEETYGLTNRIKCTTGVCGSAYSGSVTFTVTDSCSQSISKKLLNTGGSWIRVSACDTYAQGGATVSPSYWTIPAADSSSESGGVPTRDEHWCTLAIKYLIADDKRWALYPVPSGPNFYSHSPCVKGSFSWETKQSYCWPPPYGPVEAFDIYSNNHCWANMIVSDNPPPNGTWEWQEGQCAFYGYKYYFWGCDGDSLPPGP